MGDVSSGTLMPLCRSSLATATLRLECRRRVDLVGFGPRRAPGKQHGRSASCRAAMPMPTSMSAWHGGIWPNDLGGGGHEGSHKKASKHMFYMNGTAGALLGIPSPGRTARL